MLSEGLIAFLNRKAEEYDRAFFIEADPVSVPHRFSNARDQEISGFFAAIFAWGNRKTIINKANELMELMDNAPSEFIKNASAPELRRLQEFRHRTFNYTDLLYFIEFFRHHYQRHSTLEAAFTMNEAWAMEERLNNFHSYFFSLEDVPQRTRKHIAAPFRNSSCKRLNMFLRWMVRKSEVDLGLWKNIPAAQLIIPLDVHVARVARHFGLLQRKQTDWQAAIELTGELRKLDKDDPCKYDFSLFALGVLEKF